MKGPLVLSGLVFSLASESALAQRVDVAASVAIINATTVDVRGVAQFYTPAETTAQASISGFLSLYESGYDVRDMPWTAFNGHWLGGYTYRGDYGYCYIAGIDGHGTTTGVSTAYSNEACTLAPPGAPPTYHAPDICPLIIDLDGDGIPTTGLEDPVAFFDTNRDGVREASGWTTANARDAFLWMDMNGNHAPDPGELFGAGMPLPAGGYARNGFQALTVYDDPQWGGNGDGLITQDDAVWHSLRLWTDANHDGLSRPHEISTPGSEHLLSFDLGVLPIHHMGSNGNVIMFSGWYDVRLHEPHAAPYVERRRVLDISFIPANP
jgi:hypothetical protein